MTQKFEGFVAKIGRKSGSGKRGPWTLYSAKIEKVDGTEYDEWVSLGFEAPKFQEGDYIVIEAAKNERGVLEYVKGSGKKPKNPPARAQRASAGAGTASSYSGGGVDWNSAVSRAVELAGLLIEAKAFPLTGAQTKAGEAARNKEIRELVRKLSVEMYQDVKTLRLLKSVEDSGATQPVATPLPAEPAPEADEDDLDGPGSDEDNDSID